MALSWDLNKVKDCDDTCYIKVGKEGQQHQRVANSHLVTW